MTKDKIKALDKRKIRRLVYRANLAMKNLDIAVCHAEICSELLGEAGEAVEGNIRDARLNIIQALSLITVDYKK